MEKRVSLEQDIEHFVQGNVHQGNPDYVKALLSPLSRDDFFRASFYLHQSGPSTIPSWADFLENELDVLEEMYGDGYGTPGTRFRIIVNETIGNILRHSNGEDPSKIVSADFFGNPRAVLGILRGEREEPFDPSVLPPLPKAGEPITVEMLMAGNGRGNWLSVSYAEQFGFSPDGRAMYVGVDRNVTHEAPPLPGE